LENLLMTNVIAIDGPAASGKSTLALRLAKHLDFLFFDTGVMYRAVTLAALLAGVSIDDEEACVALAQSAVIEVQPPSEDDGRTNDVIVNGKDQTWAIRQPDVEGNVSVISAYKGVRDALTIQQRRIGSRGDIVMVGRDIGTVVMPDAKLKIFLDASVEERARRRFLEGQSRSDNVDYDRILFALRKRDQIDSNRDVAPLKAAEDAVVIDSDDKDADEIFEETVALSSDFLLKD
jgi:cytidylate kinase